MPQSASDDAVAREMKVRLSGGTVPSGQRATFATAILRRGPRRWRTARWMRLYDSDTGEVTKDELRVQAWDVTRRQEPFVDPTPMYEWHCDDEEIELLRSFLNEHQLEGHYRLVDIDGDLGELVEVVANAEISTQRVIALLEHISIEPDLVTALATSDVASTVVRAAEIERRRADLERLRLTIADDNATEHDIHRLLKGQSWIFGGRYVGEAVRRQLTTKSTLDIPLIRGDGSLHVVELKQAVIARLVEQHRPAGMVVGSDVNRAVGQVQNYLRDLDENRSTILTEHGIDCRRSSGTALIGNSQQVAGVPQAQVWETLRTYNSFLSRVNVMTYDELLLSAERALNFDPAETDTMAEQTDGIPPYDDEPPF